MRVLEGVYGAESLKHFSWIALLQHQKMELLGVGNFFLSNHIYCLHLMNIKLYHAHIGLLRTLYNMNYIKVHQTTNGENSEHQIQRQYHILNIEQLEHPGFTPQTAQTPNSPNTQM